MPSRDLAGHIELRDAAEAALIEIAEGEKWKGPKQMDYIALLHPDTIIGLLDRINDLELRLIEATNPGIDMADVIDRRAKS